MAQGRESGAWIGNLAGWRGEFNASWSSASKGFEKAYEVGKIMPLLFLPRVVRGLEVWTGQAR